MARKKSGSSDDAIPQGMAEAARSHELGLKLSRSERVILVGIPGLDLKLRDRLDISSTAVKSLSFKLDELARICLALSESLLHAEDRDAAQLLKVTRKVTDLMNQAVAEVERAGKSPQSVPKAGRTGAKSTAMATGRVYQLKITLKDLTPSVWRRLLVSDCSLAALHVLIQAAMGWESYHMYEFEVAGERYTDARVMADLEMKDAGRTMLSGVAPKRKAKFHYTYDFGDDWRHEVLVEKVVSPEEGRTYPICIDGKRACPPEDVGGPWGYMEFIEAIQDPKHERHEELLEWQGPFNPEEFDVEAVNKRLKGVRRSPRR